ncbi:unnamed protein product [Caenorhabditis angaria]|uniref:Uncharacterized protein n=1 Tax=Caenorhabditis angaria TaxID=860376 RepID=A0A9P1MVP1_9PELO|nr:unnamed protein product [Caenorhabditis angaria]
MRLLLLLIISISFSPSHQTRANVNFPDLLVTNQYLLVRQFGCLIHFESGIDTGMCPRSSKLQLSRQDVCVRDNTNLHLIRDPEGKHAPKLGWIRYSNLQVQINILDINRDAIFNGEGDKNHPEYIIKQGADKTHSKIIAVNNWQNAYQEHGSDMKNVYSLYDPTTRSFYIIDNRFSETKLDILYIHNIFNNKTSVSSIGKFLQNSRSSPIHVNNKQRFGWTQDPYKQTVYYKELNGGTTVYEFPISKLYEVLFDGISGKAIRTSYQNSENYMVSGGLLTDRTFSENQGTRTVTTSFRPENTTLLNLGIQCHYDELVKEHVHPLHSAMIVIRDDDYCLIRYGEKGLKACQNEREDWFAVKGLVIEHEDPIKWLIVTIIILVMLLVLLLVYVYWLRSTFVFDTENSRHDYETNEASLFVAKQRSFPSVYPDPALLDVSVDKWN